MPPRGLAAARAAWIFLAVLMSVCTQAPPSGAQTPDPTQRTVAGFSSQGLSPVDTLLRFSYREHIPMGIEYVDLHSAEEPISVAVPAGTAAHAVDAILSTEPGYGWRLRDGVVDVTHEGEPAGAKNLLDLVLPEFSVGRISRADASNALWMDVAKLLDPSIIGFGGDYPTRENPPLVGPFALRNATVRDILNRIVAGGQGAAWVVQVPPGQMGRLPGPGLWMIVEYDLPFIPVARRLRPSIEAERPDKR